MSSLRLHPSAAQLKTAGRQIASLGGTAGAGAFPMTKAAYMWALASNFKVTHLLSMAGLSEAEFCPVRMLEVYPLASRGEREILCFLAEVAGDSHEPFHAVSAMALWDKDTRLTFATWALNPFYP